MIVKYQKEQLTRNNFQLTPETRSIQKQIDINDHKHQMLEPGSYFRHNAQGFFKKIKYKLISKFINIISYQLS